MHGDCAVWIDGLLATDLVETADDVAALERPGWWAVVGEFEERWHLARFARVQPAPDPVLALQQLGAEPWSHEGAWLTSMGREDYCAAVEQLRAAIARGDIYQANLCRMLTTTNDADLLGLAMVLARHHPAPFAAFMRLPELSVVCASPERFLERTGAHIRSTPIKGTATTPERLTEKDHAENIMIVDLVRHDLAHVTVPGTIHTPRLLAHEAHPGLVHLVSDVAGDLVDGVSWADILVATFPPGSVTGAPKISALAEIRAVEPVPRGPYCGAIGWVSGDQGRLAVGIRTFFQRAGASLLHFGAGAGITWGSDPEREWEETVLKANRLIALAGGEWE